jgi:hypothetical protein
MLRASVSFFNELATEKRNYAHGFLIMVQEDNVLEGYSGRILCQGTKINHGFQEIFVRWKIITMEGTHVEGCDKRKDIRLQ